MTSTVAYTISCCRALVQAATAVVHAPALRRGLIVEPGICHDEVGFLVAPLLSQRDTGEKSL